MNNPLGTHIQVWSGGWSPDEIRGAADRAGEIGYRFLEIPVRAPETIDPDIVARILSDRGMFCTTSFLHTADTDIGSDDPETVARGEALMRRSLALARDMGSQRLTGPSHTSLAKHTTMRSPTGRRHAAEVLRRIAPLAAEYGIAICLEALNRYESNFLNTAAEILAFIEDVGAPNTYAHLDTYHMNIEEGDPADAIRKCGQRLGYFHVAENHRGYLGSGSIDFARIFRALADIGYDGPIALEVFSSAVVNPQHSARLAVWRELWSDSADIARTAKAFVEVQTAAAARRV